MASSPGDPNYYIGIMSGTSLDGIDVVLVSFPDNTSIKDHAFYSLDFPKALRSKLLEIIQPGWTGSLSDINALDAELGEIYGEAVAGLLNQHAIRPEQVSAIGNHGQTIWHQPEQKPLNTWQLGDASRIAERTGITTIADFRSRDMAAGGSGAPLVPAFHQAVFASPDENRVILNIGGIANISVLHSGETLGFDTGPGNGLMDAWCLQHTQQHYDKNGDWAASGTHDPKLLNRLQSDPYFQQKPPKSTGKEYFNLDWLDRHMAACNSELTAADIQATLLELTASSICISVRQLDIPIQAVYACGGGTNNTALMRRIADLLDNIKLGITNDLGLNTQWVEAAAFAWLAKQALEGLPGNMPSVTGAKGPRILGAIYPA